MHTNYKYVSHDLLLLIFPVYAFSAPQMVYDWIERLDTIAGTPATVISVSGGGEILSNTACRIGCIKRLECKGYTVEYEDMIVMPSNFLITTASSVSAALLQLLPAKTEQIVQSILTGQYRRVRPLFIDRILFSILAR